MTKTQSNEEWFVGLTPEQYAEMCNAWREKNLKVKLPKLASYDEAFNYFKDVSPNTIKSLMKTGLDDLSTQSYAALRVWSDILSNPHRMKTVHQSGLQRTSAGKSITELAKSNDHLKVLYALRDRIAEKLDAGAGTRDTALLSRELGDVLEQIRDYERRQGPKKGTKLSKLIEKEKPKTKVTIDDLDA